MRIYLLSDIHLEVFTDRRESYRPSLDGIDVVVLAGDIDKGPRALAWARRTFPCRVVYVAGNHDYWGEHLQKMQAKLREASDDRVRYLERDEAIIDGVRFLGATAWTNFACLGDVNLGKLVSRSTMTDYQRIRAGSGYGPFRTEHWEAENAAARLFFCEKLSENFAGPTVVVTHHAPVLEHAHNYVPTMYDRRNGIAGLDASYCNNWRDLVFGDPAKGIKPPAAWLWGHTHEAIDKVVDGVRLASNPFGWGDYEETGFNPELVIEV